MAPYFCLYYFVRTSKQTSRPHICVSTQCASHYNNKVGCRVRKVQQAVTGHIISTDHALPPLLLCCIIRFREKGRRETKE